MTTAKVTANKAVRLVGGLLCAVFMLAGLGRAGEALFELASYGVGHPVKPVLELPLSFFDGAKSGTMSLAGGSSQITVTVFSGTYEGQTIAVLSRQSLDRAQEYHPAIREERFDAQVSALADGPVSAFDAVVSVPGYYSMKLLSGLALAAVTGVILLFCLDRHQALFDFIRAYTEERKEEKPR